MQKTFYLFVFLLTVAVFSSILPYPIFSRHTNISNEQAFLINNFHETELTQSEASRPKITDLSFAQINLLLPIGTKFEIFDFESERAFFVMRTGGKNHIDVEPSDKENSIIIKKIRDFSWDRRPVLVKLSETAYAPASLVLYPHGYCTGNTATNGHFCLHFENTRTDGTNQIDDAHQKSVNLARKLGQKYLENQML